MGKELILASFVRRYSGRTFKWGIRDCNTLAVEWFDILKGTHYANVIKGKYETLEGAKKVLKKQKQDLYDFLTRHGAKQIPETLVADGDFVVFENTAGFVGSGIVYKHRVLCPFVDRGILLVPLAMWHLESIFLRIE